MLPIRTLTIASAIALAASAQAADVYSGGPGGYKDGPYAAPLWTGFYVGIHGGYGTGDWDGHQTYTDASANDPYHFDRSTHSIGVDGALVGGQIGYNWQRGHLVIGAEADASWADINGKKHLFPYPDDPARGTGVGTPGWNFGIENEWLATFRGRLGYDMSGVLLYGTGGLALGGFHETHSITGYPWSGAGSSDETKVGWTIGAGSEVALGGGWSVKGEYLYISFSDVGGTIPFDDPALGKPTDGFKGDFDIHTFKAGLNYKFGSVYEPLK